jgi:DNA-binding NarL/FixJ family response regulator
MSTIMAPSEQRPPARSAIRVLVADDHPLIRRLLRTVLAARDGIAVVGEASDGAHAIELALALAPEVVVVDLSMPGMDGLEAVAAIRGDLPGCRILVFSANEPERTAAAALAAGADAYLSKDDGFEAVADAVAALAAGD